MPVFSKRVDAMGIAEVVTAPSSSWQNAYVERVSARSAESVWTTSSSSTSAICVASFHRTWITTTALGHISPWTRIARNSGRYRRARSGISSPSLKSAGCIIDTSASRRDFFALTNDCRCSDRCGAVQTSLDRSKLASSYPGGSREFRSQPNDIAARTSSSPDSDGNFRRDRSKSFKESSRSFRPQVRSQGRTKCQCRSSSRMRKNGRSAALYGFLRVLAWIVQVRVRGSKGRVCRSERYSQRLKELPAPSCAS